MRTFFFKIIERTEGDCSLNFLVGPIEETTV